MPRAQDLIASAYRRFTTEVPALDKLKLVIRLELRGRGDVQVFRVRIPGPEVTKQDPQDARIEISMSRSHFNELAAQGRVKDYRQAYEHGDIKVAGDTDVQKLIARVIQRHEARGRLKKVR